MKKIYIATIVAGVFFLLGCSSMRPPSTNPYYPGYHSRNPKIVDQEYQDWQHDQEVRAERKRVQDSLWADYYEKYGDQPMFFGQFNYYGNYYPYWRSPYHRRFSRWYGYGPYNRYYPYGNSWSMSFSYSNQPWFVDTWWADDYLWDQHFWGYPYNSYYSSWYVRPPIYGYGYYNDPYYDWYGYPYRHYTNGGGSGRNQDHPRGPRPRNRDSFGGGSIVGPSGGTPPAATAGGSIVGGPPPASSDNGSVTPAVIDRSKFKTKSSRTFTRDRYSPSANGGLVDRNRGSDNNSSSSSKSRTVSRSKSSASSSPPRSRSVSRSGSRLSSSSGTVSRGSSSSGKSSGSSSKSSSSSNKRSRNRNR